MTMPIKYYMTKGQQFCHRHFQAKKSLFSIAFLILSETIQEKLNSIFTFVGCIPQQLM